MWKLKNNGFAEVSIAAWVLCIAGCQPSGSGPNFATGLHGGTDAASSSSGGKADTTSTSSTSGTTSSSTTSTPNDSSDGSSSTGGSPAEGFCENGVALLYVPESGKAKPWTLGFDDWEARALFADDDVESIEGEEAEMVVTASGQVRLGVDAEEGSCDGETDQAKALEQGYMCGPNDWKNYEVTGYLQLVEAAGDSSDQDWTFYGGGGRHTGSGAPDGCMGSAYKGSYHYADAEVRFGKESWHVNYDYKYGWVPVADGIDYTDSDKWLGMKLVRYEFERGGERGMRNEIWLDLGGVDENGEPANDWFLASVAEDHPQHGSWGEDASECGVEDDQIMFWGGPKVTYRWDNTTTRLRLACVREIVPPTDVPEPQ